MQHYFNAINCFTDASKTNINGVDTICAGYAVVYQNQILDTGLKVVYDATSMYGEELAIYMGMDALLKYAKYDTFLNLRVLSFSKINETVDIGKSAPFNLQGINSWLCTHKRIKSKT